ncbi:hypothetical protein EVAR_21226_1 [Eumeta japonica]|uniref:Uncharacterized protein n=1 Tax=Eumeta variegata TaxID=151549 RepID=A0A4C1UQI7_EUMVA|nr:hypothetical protein EVAR_21226_1 [Eumeta japonica]
METPPYAFILQTCKYNKTMHFKNKSHLITGHLLYFAQRDCNLERDRDRYQERYPDQSWDQDDRSKQKMKEHIQYPRRRDREREASSSIKKTRIEIESRSGSEFRVQGGTEVETDMGTDLESNKDRDRGAFFKIDKPEAGVGSMVILSGYNYQSLVEALSERESINQIRKMYSIETTANDVYPHVLFGSAHLFTPRALHTVCARVRTKSNK